MIHLAQPHEMPAAWRLAAPMLIPALARAGGRWTLWAVHDELTVGRADLWLAYPEPDRPENCGAAVCRIAQYPARRFYSVLAVGGSNMAAWGEDLLAAIEDRANALGLDGIEGSGRMGWERMGQRHGFRCASVIMEKWL